MLDALICGAGPAGSIAALVMARAGARVLIVDRETFPRDKLCGDTLNPGAIALLRSLGLDGGPLDEARPFAGMLLSGPHAAVRTIYGDGVYGRSIVRREFDVWLLEQAIKAGARFESHLVAREPLIADASGEPIVRGLVLTRRSDPSQHLRIPAVMTIAADGAQSVIARAAGLSAHPRRPRRWAFGVYATGVRGLTDVGEMHVRRGHYIGIAPLPNGLANICVVTGPRPAGRTPLDVVQRFIRLDGRIASRLDRASFVTNVKVLGPLAVESRACGVPGLLLAGDAAGFVDPMTGDGMHLAMQGSVLAAHEALRAGESGDFRSAVRRLEEARRRRFGAKLRFNLAMRRIVASPAAVEAACVGAKLAPGIIRRLVRHAGDI